MAFSKYNKDIQLSLGDKVIVSKEQFINNFNLFTEYQLADINWNNLFVAGGAVLASLMHVPPNYNKSTDPLSKRKGQGVSGEDPPSYGGSWRQTNLYPSFELYT